MRFNSVLFDLDMTIVDTSSLLGLRKQRRWNDVYAQLNKTKIIKAKLGNVKKKTAPSKTIKIYSTIDLK